LQDVKKDIFFGGDEGVSNFKITNNKHKIFHNKVTIRLFSIEYHKNVVFIVLHVVAGVCCVPAPLFISFFDEQRRHNCAVMV
jgi:hypothetical protein